MPLRWTAAGFGLQIVLLNCVSDCVLDEDCRVWYKFEVEVSLSDYSRDSGVALHGR